MSGHGVSPKARWAAVVLTGAILTVAWVVVFKAALRWIGWLP